MLINRHLYHGSGDTQPNVHIFPQFSKPSLVFLHLRVLMIDPTTRSIVLKLEKAKDGYKFIIQDKKNEKTYLFGVGGIKRNYSEIFEHFRSLLTQRII